MVVLRAVRIYTDAADVSGQIAELSANCQDIFMDIVRHIIPFGDFYKKDKVLEIVRKEVTDTVLRRKMLRLLAPDIFKAIVGHWRESFDLANPV